MFRRFVGVGGLVLIYLYLQTLASAPRGESPELPGAMATLVGIALGAWFLLSAINFMLMVFDSRIAPVGGWACFCLMTAIALSSLLPKVEGGDAFAGAWGLLFILTGLITMVNLIDATVIYAFKLPRL